MAPTFMYWDVTPVMVYRGNEVYANPCRTTKKVETKQERINRLAKQKRLESYKTHNQRASNVIEIKSFLIPRKLLYTR